MKKISLIYLLVIFSAIASGQTEKLINPADLKQQTVITEPLTLQKGFLRVGLFYTYTLVDKYFDSSAKKTFPPGNGWSSSNDFQLWTQYGVTDRFMVELGIPYTDGVEIYHQKLYAPIIDTLVSRNFTTRGKGLGDILMSASYQIIPSKDHKFSLRGQLELTLPTGRKNPTNVVNSNEYDAPTGNGAFVVTPGLYARLLEYPFSFTAFLYYDYKFKGSKIMNAGDTQEKMFKDGDHINPGGSINFQLNDWIALTNELDFHYRGKGEEEGVPASDLYTQWLIEYSPYLIFQIRRFRLGEAVNIPLKGKSTGADPQYVLFVQYVF
jgi:Putative MetA-pathway of phenol degradation